MPDPRERTALIRFLVHPCADPPIERTPAEVRSANEDPWAFAESVGLTEAARRHLASMRRSWAHPQPGSEWEELDAGDSAERRERWRERLWREGRV